jgi:hypothetical protein
MAGDRETLLDDVSGRLEIELSLPTERLCETLSNQKALPDAQLISVALEAYTFRDGERCALSDAELDEVALVEKVVRLRSRTSAAISRFDAPNGVHFTVRDLLSCVEETERQARPSSVWFDGIDVHHVFFEGLGLEEDGVWRIDWGS